MKSVFTWPPYAIRAPPIYQLARSLQKYQNGRVLVTLSIITVMNSLLVAPFQVADKLSGGSTEAQFSTGVFHFGKMRFWKNVDKLTQRNIDETSIAWLDCRSPQAGRPLICFKTAIADFSNFDRFVLGLLQKMCLGKALPPPSFGKIG